MITQLISTVVHLSTNNPGNAFILQTASSQKHTPTGSQRVPSPPSTKMISKNTSSHKWEIPLPMTTAQGSHSELKILSDLNWYVGFQKSNLSIVTFTIYSKVTQHVFILLNWIMLYLYSHMRHAPPFEPILHVLCSPESSEDLCVGERILQRRIYEYGRKFPS